MSESHDLPAKVEISQLEKADSSLLTRAISALSNTSGDESLDQLYQKALTFFEGVDFLSFSKISLLEPERLSKAQTPAIDLLLQAAKQGHRDAQYSLGALYADGGAVKWNGAEALKWYSMAARHGHGDAAFQIVKYLRLDPDSARGIAVDQLSDARMHEYLEIAATDGHRDAPCHLGNIFLTKAKSGDVGSHGNYAQAAHWFQKAADFGDVESAFNLAEILCLGDGVPENHVDAARWYAFAAEQNQVHAMLELAYLYERGLGVQKDKSLAIRWYRKAACLILESGDAKAAVGWIETAAMLGDTEASKELGELYYTLGCDTKLLTDRFKFWRKAIDFDSANAAYQLGKYYDLSDSTSTSFKDVLQLYETAAKLGHVDVQCALGDIFGQGRGAAQDYSESVKWYVAAAEQGHVESAYHAGYRFRWGGAGLEINKTEAAK